MASNLLLVDERSNCFNTEAVSCICGIAFGETKLPKSMVSKPMFNRELMYFAFISVGMSSLMPCIASLGHSMIFIRSGLFFKQSVHQRYTEKAIHSRRFTN